MMREKPDVSKEDVIDSIKVAFENQDAPNGLLRDLGLTYQWEVLRSVIQNEDVFDNKWKPWILANLGKQNEIVRESKQS